MRDMCMTVKMKINVDDFDKEEEKLRREALQLYEQKLLSIGTGQTANDSYVLTDKGELYIVQKIIKPLYDAKMKGDLIQIKNYFKTEAEKQLLQELYTNMNTQDPRGSLLRIAEIVLKFAMPALQILNLLHQIDKLPPSS